MEALFRDFAHGQQLLSVEEFLEAHPEPALIVERLPGPSEGGAEGGEDDCQRPFTLVPADTVGPDGSAPRFSAEGVRLDATLHWIAKTSRNPFGAFVTLGRARNNDIIIASSSVSKTHLFFTQVGERWYVEDRNTTNGTFLNGQRIPGGQRVELESGVAIRVGKARRAWFLQPGDLWEQCRLVQSR